MQNSEYYIKALQNNLHLNRDWVLSCFCTSLYVNYDEADNAELYHMQLIMRGSDTERAYWFNKDDPDNPIELTDYIPHKPLMSFKDRIALKPGDLLNVKSAIETNYGNCLFNAIALIYPFGDKIEFITGKVNCNKLENIISNNLHDTPTPDETRDINKFYVDELVKHADAITSLESYNFICVPTTSASTMLPNAAVVKRRDELLRVHKDELHKPAIVAKIQEELAALDKESFKNDPASGFYISGKSYDIIRMKKFIMLGLIGGFGGEKPELVTSSLAEGWQKESLPAMIDDVRSGSYSRGISTAIAGAGVKLIYNAFQTVTVSQDDCGQTNGMSWYITEDNYGMFIGRYMIAASGLVELDAATTREHIGKTISVRTPMLCKVPPPSYCAKCAGNSISMLPKSVHITASDISSIYMNDAMKSMHGKSLKTKTFNIVTANK